MESNGKSTRIDGRPLDADTVLVGVDDFARKLVGPPATVKTPALSEWLHQGGRAFALKLDDKVADDVALSDTLDCRIVIKRFEPAFAKAIAAWKFAARDENLVWEGRIAGPDRLRFLGMISRYSALVGDISLTENTN